MAKAMWPFRDLHAPSRVPGPRTDVPAEFPLAEWQCDMEKK
jgi:hypothetical protein